MIALAGLLSAATMTAQEAVPKELAPLQGTWVILTTNGNSMDGGPEVAFVVKGSTYQQTVNADVQERGTIKIDASKKPMAIDLSILEGDDVGKTQLGVLEITGDTAKVKMAAPGSAERPKDFEPQDGTFAFTAKKRG